MRRHQVHAYKQVLQLRLKIQANAQQEKIVEPSPSQVIFFEIDDIDSMQRQLEAFMDVNTVTVEENENGHYLMEIKDPHGHPVIIRETYKGMVARNRGNGLDPAEFSEKTSISTSIISHVIGNQ